MKRKGDYADSHRRLMEETNRQFTEFCNTCGERESFEERLEWFVKERILETVENMEANFVLTPDEMDRLCQSSDFVDRIYRVIVSDELLYREISEHMGIVFRNYAAKCMDDKKSA